MPEIAGACLCPSAPLAAFSRSSFAARIFCRRICLQTHHRAIPRAPRASWQGLLRPSMCQPLALYPQSWLECPQAHLVLLSVRAIGARRACFVAALDGLFLCLDTLDLPSIHIPHSSLLMRWQVHPKSCWCRCCVGHGLTDGTNGNEKAGTQT